MTNVTTPTLSHVALLVRSVSTAASIAQTFGFPNGPTSIWEGEGTKEIYVGEESKTGLLLLMEPVQIGSYSRAIQKRGPGLHHIAIDVLDLDEYILSLSGSGWLLHPNTIKTMKSTRTAYLARPGVQTLIEVQERNSIPAKELFVKLVEIPIPLNHVSMLKALGVPNILPSSDSHTWVTATEKRFPIDLLLVTQHQCEFKVPTELKNDY